MSKDKKGRTDFRGFFKILWGADDESKKIDVNGVEYDAVTQEDLEQIAKLNKRLKTIEENYTYTFGAITGNKKARKRIFQNTNHNKGEDSRIEQVPMKGKKDQNERSEGSEIADE